MKIIGILTAAALVVGALGAAPAAAQRHDGDRDGTMSDNDRDRDRDRGDRDRDRDWNDGRGDRGHHYGWRNNRRHKVKVCRTVWRHHHRQRVCTWR
jgi:hypothetical protein